MDTPMIFQGFVKWELWFRISFESTFGMRYVGPYHSIEFVCPCYSVRSSCKLDSSTVVEAPLPMPQNFVDVLINGLETPRGQREKAHTTMGSQGQKAFG